MQYLTYGEYITYGGDDNVETSDFNLMEFKARKRIDYLTGCRVQAMKTVPEAVKRTMMIIIKHDARYDADAQADNPLITSYTTDGYSESYGGADAQTRAAEANLTRSIRDLLYGEVDDRGVPLLYRGVYDA